MKVNKIGIVVFLVTMSLMMGSAAAVNVNPNMNNAQIQNVVNSVPIGSTINFLPGTYNGISLTINKTLSLTTNGATLIGNGSSVMNIAGTSGVSIQGFNININNRDADGITGSNVYNCTIENNTITNGEDGINIFMLYANLTINNNTINDMAGTNGDGISLVNHNTAIDMSTFVPSTITNNHISNTLYGIFLGGNFKGDVTGNSIAGTTAGMSITGKKAATNGILSANIINNSITGIAMECPHVQYLSLDNNAISQLGTSGYSILTNGYFVKTGSISVTNNPFTYPVTPEFMGNATTWTGNTLDGNPYP